MFRPAVLLDLAGLNLAGRLDLSGLRILPGTSWQLMQHSLNMLLMYITNVEISNFNFQLSTDQLVQITYFDPSTISNVMLQMS